MWKLIAWILSRKPVATAIINHALRTPYFHLPSNEDPSYMERYWVFNPYQRANNQQAESKYKWFPWNIRVHWIKRADRELHLHDHPWHARTIILKGGYVEERLLPFHLGAGSEQFIRTRGDTATIGYEQYHRITNVTDGGTWTLFISSKYQGIWGFLVDGVKVPFKEYLGL